MITKEMLNNLIEVSIKNNYSGMITYLIEKHKVDPEYIEKKKKEMQILNI